MDPFYSGGEKHSLVMDSEYFAKPPHRSFFLCSGTALLVVVTFITAFVMVRHWDRLPTTTVYYLLFSVVGMSAFWVLAIQNYREIHGLFTEGAIADVRPGSPIDLALRVAATMIHTGMFLLFFLVGMLVTQIDKILGHP